MVAASEGPTDTHHDGVRLLALATLTLFVAALVPAGGVLAKPSHEAELLDQTIDLGLPPSGVVGDVVVLEGTASSALPLSYEAKPPKRCNIEDDTLLLQAPGICKIIASQPGDVTYAAAEAKAELEIEPAAAAEDPAARPDVKADSKAQHRDAGKSEAEPRAREPKAKEPKPEPRAREPKAKEPKAKEPKPEPKAREPRAKEPRAKEPRAKEPKPEPKAKEPKSKRDAPGGASSAAAQAVSARSDQRSDEASNIVAVERTGDATPPAASSTYPLAERPLIIPPANYEEGDSGTHPLGFTAACDPDHKTEVRFNYLTESGTATEGIDYKQTKGTVSIPVGQSSGNFSVDIIGDTLDEPDETFAIHISDVIGAEYSGEVVTGTILDDDRTLTVDDRALAEGGGLTNLPLVFRLSKSLPDPVTFDYWTGAAGDTASGGNDPGTDYVSESGSITIPPYTTYYDEEEVTIWGDSTFERDEYFHVCIDNVVGATPGRSCARVTIRNDDDPPELTITGYSSYEGDSGISTKEFVAELSEPSGRSAAFDWVTADDTATAADSDYVVTGDSSAFLPGQTSMRLYVDVNGDTNVEADERFGIKVSNPEGLTYDPTNGTPYWTILSDDWPRIELVNVKKPEGDAGTSVFSFNAYLSEPALEDTTFVCEVVADTATETEDYVAPAHCGGFIPKGNYWTQQSIDVVVNGDEVIERDERFEVVIVSARHAEFDADSSAIGTIVTDDGPGIAVADTTVGEGDGSAVFTVSLDGTSQDEVVVHYQTSGQIARAGTDYTAVSGEVRFQSGESIQTVDVPIVDDAVEEPDEGFALALSDPEGGFLARAYATATIIDDDGSDPPTSEPPAPPPVEDTAPPAISAPTADFARLTLTRTSAPIPLSVGFTAADPSGIADTTLQHRIGSAAFRNVPLASPRNTRTTVRVSANAKLIHRFRSQATDGAGNTSAFVQAPATRVKVIQDGSRAVKKKGPWATKRARAFFGRTIKRTTRKGARVQLTARGTDFAIVATKGRDKGKARVLVDGRPVAVVDLYARRAKPRTIVHAVSFAKPGRHTVALQALGKKNPRAKGKRVELDAFLVLTP